MSVTVATRNRTDVYALGETWGAPNGILTVFSEGSQHGLATYAAGEWLDVFLTNERTQSTQTSVNSIGIF